MVRSFRSWVCYPVQLRFPGASSGPTVLGVEFTNSEGRNVNQPEQRDRVSTVVALCRVHTLLGKSGPSIFAVRVAHLPFCIRAGPPWTPLGGFPN
jgi:hypothetical protein